MCSDGASSCIYNLLQFDLRASILSIMEKKLDGMIKINFNCNNAMQCDARRGEASM